MEIEDDNLADNNYEINNKYIHELANNKLLELLVDNTIKSKIYSNKSACYLILKDFVNSLNNALLSIKCNNFNAKAWGRIAWSFKGLKNNENALDAFKIAHKFDPLNINYKKEIYFYNLNKIDKFNLFKLFKSSNYIINKFKNKDFTNKLLLNIFNQDNLLKDEDILHLIDYIIHKI